MRRTISIALTVGLVAGGLLVALQAQPKPNFAGKWTLVPDPNATPTGRGRGMGGLGQTFAAEQNDKTLTVITSNPQVGEIKAIYNLDGSETKNPITFGGNTVDRTSKVKWDGARLIITSTSNFQGNAVETTQAWSLDAAGSLTVESTTNFGATPTTTKATYKKG